MSQRSGSLILPFLLLFALGGLLTRPTEAFEERRLSFCQTHTQERVSVVYKIGDHYQAEALGKVNQIFRDHRSGEVYPIDPELLDFLHDLLTVVNNHGEVHIISAYRSPQTNEKLRRTGGGGVARSSLHMKGKALDFRLPGTDTKQLRDAALAMRRGGVGYYPELDFVQIDIGRVRWW